MIKGFQLIPSFSYYPPIGDDFVVTMLMYLIPFFHFFDTLAFW